MDYKSASLPPLESVPDEIAPVEGVHTKPKMEGKNAFQVMQESAESAYRGAISNIWWQTKKLNDEIAEKEAENMGMDFYTPTISPREAASRGLPGQTEDISEYAFGRKIEWTEKQEESDLKFTQHLMQTQEAWRWPWAVLGAIGAEVVNVPAHLADFVLGAGIRKGYAAVKKSYKIHKAFKAAKAAQLYNRGQGKIIDKTTRIARAERVAKEMEFFGKGGVEDLGRLNLAETGTASLAGTVGANVAEAAAARQLSLGNGHEYSLGEAVTMGALFPIGLKMLVAGAKGSIRKITGNKPAIGPGPMTAKEISNAGKRIEELQAVVKKSQDVNLDKIDLESPEFKELAKANAELQNLQINILRRTKSPTTIVKMSKQLDLNDEQLNMFKALSHVEQKWGNKGVDQVLDVVYGLSSKGINIEFDELFPVLRDENTLAKALDEHMVNKYGKDYGKRILPNDDDLDDVILKKTDEEWETYINKHKPELESNEVKPPNERVAQTPDDNKAFFDQQMDSSASRRAAQHDEEGTVKRIDELKKEKERVVKEEEAAAKKEATEAKKAKKEGKKPKKAAKKPVVYASVDEVPEVKKAKTEVEEALTQARRKREEDSINRQKIDKARKEVEEAKKVEEPAAKSELQQNIDTAIELRKLRSKLESKRTEASTLRKDISDMKGRLEVDEADRLKRTNEFKDKLKKVNKEVKEMKAELDNQLTPKIKAFLAEISTGDPRVEFKDILSHADDAILDLDPSIDFRTVKGKLKDLKEGLARNKADFEKAEESFKAAAVRDRGEPDYKSKLEWHRNKRDKLKRKYFDNKKLVDVYTRLDKELSAKKAEAPKKATTELEELKDAEIRLAEIDALRQKVIDIGDLKARRTDLSGKINSAKNYVKDAKKRGDADALASETKELAELEAQKADVVKRINEGLDELRTALNRPDLRTTEIDSLDLDSPVEGLDPVPGKIPEDPGRRAIHGGVRDRLERVRARIKELTEAKELKSAEAPAKRIPEGEEVKVRSDATNSVEAHYALTIKKNLKIKPTNKLLENIQGEALKHNTLYLSGATRKEVVVFNARGKEIRVEFRGDGDIKVDNQLFPASPELKERIKAGRIANAQMRLGAAKFKLKYLLEAKKARKTLDRKPITDKVIDEHKGYVTRWEGRLKELTDAEPAPAKKTTPKRNVKLDKAEAKLRKAEDAGKKIDEEIKTLEKKADEASARQKKAITSARKAGLVKSGTSKVEKLDKQIDELETARLENLRDPVEAAKAVEAEVDALAKCGKLTGGQTDAE